MKNNLSKYYISQLIFKSISKIISTEEKENLEEWLKIDSNRKLYDRIVDQENIREKIVLYDQIHDEQVFERLKKRIEDDQRPVLKLKETKPIPRVFKWVAVAIIFIGLGYLYQIGYFSSDIKDIAPIESITLQQEDGSIKVLNEDGSFKVMDAQGNVVGTQNGNQLTYSDTIASEALVYNMLSVPYGKRFKIKLSDGTMVNLNAGTSLKYPVKFIKGKNRKVFLNGEAYFNVAKDANHPFIVNANQVDVRVLGTQFNVTSYPEDDHINTVLVEGQVGIYDKETEYSPKIATVLQPGFIGAWNKNNNIIEVAEVDIEMHTAWIEGRIIFKHVPFNKIIKKLERHYNVEIINNDKTLDNQLITASFDIETIGQVFKVINLIHPIDYTIKDSKIVIN